MLNSIYTFTGYFGANFARVPRLGAALRPLVRAAARREAAELIKTAENDAAAASDTYASAWTAAKDAGWTPAQLRSMGYDKPPATRKRAGRGRNSATTSAAHSDAGSDETTPEAAATAVA